MRGTAMFALCSFGARGIACLTKGMMWIVFTQPFILAAIHIVLIVKPHKSKILGDHYQRYGGLGKVQIYQEFSARSFWGLQPSIGVLSAICSLLSMTRPLPLGDRKWSKLACLPSRRAFGPSETLPLRDQPTYG